MAEKPINHEQVITNRAEVQSAELSDCEQCFESLLFAMRDSRGNEFTVGLNTLLECLMFAQEQGALPEFPKEMQNWWLDVQRHYNLTQRYFLKD